MDVERIAYGLIDLLEGPRVRSRGPGVTAAHCHSNCDLNMIIVTCNLFLLNYRY